MLLKSLSFCIPTARAASADEVTAALRLRLMFGVLIGDRDLLDSHLHLLVNTISFF